MITQKLSTKDQEILKYYLMYLGDSVESMDSMLESEYGKALTELLGSRWVDWMIDLIKLDREEYQKFKEITSAGSLVPYFKGNEKSFAYQWLITIW